MGQFDAVFGNEASRRTFLKGVGVLGASGVLAACRKSVDDSSVAGAGTTASIAPIEDEPGLCTSTSGRDTTPSGSTPTT